MICTTLTTACQDPLVGDWNLDSFDVPCVDSQVPYDYQGQTIYVDSQTCLNDFEMGFSLDGELTGTLTKWEGVFGVTYSYGGNTSDTYDASFTATGEVEAEKNDSDYKITIDLTMDISFEGNTGEVEEKEELECTLTGDKLTCKDGESGTYELSKP